MLSTKIVRSHWGKFYYAVENTCTEKQGQMRSQWFGAGTSELNLKGQVGYKTFQTLLDGQLPDGQLMRQKETIRPDYQERAGLDCTFSAPKSVSLMALLKGESAIALAHQESVILTLQLVQERYAQTRIRVEGKRSIVETRHLTAALFEHDVSRLLDPQLHTHAVLLNGTRWGERWSALHNDAIHHHKKFLGLIYQNELALRLKGLGYAIAPKGNGLSEIEGFTLEQLRHFSKRTQQVESILGEDPSWWDRKNAVLNTRAVKPEVKRSLLLKEWKQKVLEVGLEFPRPKFSYKEQDTLDVDTAVAIALNNCSQKWETFEMERLEGELLLQNLGQLPLQVWQESLAECDRLRYLDKGWVTQSEKSIYPVPAFKSRIISVDRFYKQVQGDTKNLDSFGQPRRSPPDLDRKEMERLIALLDRFLEKVGERSPRDPRSGAAEGSLIFRGKQWSLTKQKQRICIFDENRKLWESQGDAIVTFNLNALELEKLRQLCQQFEADPSLREPIVHSYSREQGQTSLQMNQLTKPLQR